MRRLTKEVLARRGGQTLWESLRKLGADSVSATAELTSGIAVMLPRIIPQIIKQPPTPARVADYGRDALRMTETLWRRS